MTEPATDPLLTARALLLHDLTATDVATPQVVSLLEDAVAERRWWVQQWPQGEEFVVGLVAQDVADRLLEVAGRWPLCPAHPQEALQVEPELGADPRWVCTRSCGQVAAVGSLPRRGAPAPPPAP